MGKKHKKHKKHYFEQDTDSADITESAGAQMKVVLKLSGSAHKSSTYTEPSWGPPPLEEGDHSEELLVSIPLVLLRPATPTGMEEEMEVVPRPPEHKHHKVKKHKKHKKHSYREGGGGGEQGPENITYRQESQGHKYHQGETSGHTHSVSKPGHTHSSSTLDPSLSQSGKHFSFSQTSQMQSPFKFTISGLDSSSSSAHTTPLQSTPGIQLSDGSTHISPLIKTHKHKKKHHHHHHHPHSSPHLPQPHQPEQPEEKMAQYSPERLGVVPYREGVVSGGKPRSMFLAGEGFSSDSEDFSSLSHRQSYEDSPQLSVERSHDSSDTTHSSMYDSMKRESHDRDARSYDLGSGKVHKKKKDKKKKRKHSRQEPCPSHIPTVTHLPIDEGSTTPSLKRGRVSGPDDYPVPKKLHSDTSISKPASPTLEHKTTPLPTSPPASTPDVVPTKLTPPTALPSPQVKLSSSALKFFLKNIHHLIRKRDPEGVFSEPVTDDIAPNYSSIISTPMDLTTMASKIETEMYPSVKEFKSDFILMCNNAMTYNAPETTYYGTAKRLLSSGLQIIAKEISLRPDIRLGRVSSRSISTSPLAGPPHPPDFSLPPPSNTSLNYSSAFLCRLPLTHLQSSPPGPSISQGADFMDVDYVNIDIGVREVKDQSHLTRVVVGCEDELEEVESPEDILQQVQEEVASVKENLESSGMKVKYSFVNQNSSGKTMLNLLNPDTGQVDSSKPVDLSALSDHVRMGNNAATVLRTELPMMKATPVSYLMYGPFGSFAPIYDSAFATLSKMDSDLLLSTYGSELGVSYAHSLQQFVRGSGGFVSEMANAVLNGLTNNRHTWFSEKLKAFEKKEKMPEAKGVGNGDTPLPSNLKKEEEIKKENDVSNTARPTRTLSNELAGDIERSRSKESTTSIDGSRALSQGASVDTPVSRGSSVDTPVSRGSSVDAPVSRGSSVDASVSRGSSVDASVSRGASVEASMSRRASEAPLSRGGSMSRGASVEAPLSRGGSVEASVSRGASVEAPLSRGGSVEASMSRGASVEASMSRGASVEASMSRGASVDASVSREASVEAPLSRGTSVEAPLSSGASVASSPRMEDHGSKDISSESSSLSIEEDTSRDSSINMGLMKTSSLLSQLQEHQEERLSQSPYVSQDHLILPGPSEQEVGMASEIRQELANLTAVVQPGDVVSVSALHNAMGIVVEPMSPPPPRPPSPLPPPLHSPSPPSSPSTTEAMAMSITSNERT